MSKFAPDVPASLIDAVNSIIVEAKVEPAKPDPEAIARKKRLDALRDKQDAERAEKGEEKPKSNVRVHKGTYGTEYKGDVEEELKGNQHKIDANKNGKIDADDFKKLRGEELKGNQHKIDANKNGKIDAHDFKLLRSKKKANEEVEEIEERELTPGEAEKKEKYVKSMKKGLAGFKARYGDRAKNVMYATATKMAKEEVEVEIDVEDLNEGKMKDIYTSMMAHADKKGYSSHKDFTPKDYDEVGKEHGISGKDLAVIAGHKTAQQVSKEGVEKQGKIISSYVGKNAGKKDLPFTPDKPHAPIAKAGKYGYGPSAAKHLAKQGMKSVKEETVEEGTGGPIYPKPFVKLGDLLSRIKDFKNIKKATIVTPKDENEVVMKKESFEEEHGVDVSKKKVKKETMMGKAGCTSEDIELTESAGDKLLQTAREYKNGSTGYHKGMIKYHDYMADVHYGKPKGDEHEERLRHHKSELAKLVKSEEVELDETAVLDKYIKSMGYDPKHLDKNKKVMFSKTNAFKTFAMSQEALYDGGQKGTQDIDTHMSPGATARGK